MKQHYSYYLTIAGALVVIVGGTYLFPRVGVNSDMLLGDVSGVALNGTSTIAAEPAPFPEDVTAEGAEASVQTPAVSDLAVVDVPIPAPTLVSLPQSFLASISRSISNLMPTLPTITLSFVPALKNIINPVRPSTSIVPTSPTHAGDSSRNYAVVQADYSLNGTLVHTTTVYPDGWRLDTSTLEDGQYTLETKVSYADGTKGSSQTTFMVANGPTAIEQIVAYIRGVLGK